MDSFTNLTEQNFLLYAIKCYETPNCIMSEFSEDLKKIKYVKRLFRKYKISNTIKERLILNHIICLGNVFGVEAATRLLFFRVEPKDYDVLKTFLIYLEYMPDIVHGIAGINIRDSDIPIDLSLVTKLREI